MMSADSLAPDVAASVEDTLVYAGTKVEITAEGSPDVASMTLTDGLGRKSPFGYDEQANRWRVLYRVPVRNPSDRIAVSVTARTESNRWRRVWVFLHVQREVNEAQAPADSAR